MTEIISSTEAARQLGDLLARVKHRGDRFILTRNKRPVPELRSVSSGRRGTFEMLRVALEKLPVDPEFAEDLERVNQADLVSPNPWPIEAPDS